MNEQTGGAGGESGGQGDGGGQGDQVGQGGGGALEGGSGQESTQANDVEAGRTGADALVETPMAPATDDLNEQGGPTGIQAEVDASSGEQHPPSEPVATDQDFGHPTREEREREASEQAERDRVAAQQNEGDGE
jgi:hypothetical protein